jgi:hypothetical protein
MMPDSIAHINPPVFATEDSTRDRVAASKASQQVQDVQQELQKAMWHKGKFESRHSSFEQEMKDLETRFNQQQVLHQREVQVHAFSFS